MSTSSRIARIAGLSMCSATPKIVGAFFEDLARSLLEGVQNCIPTDGDFVNWRLGAGFEVKASDNNHHFRIPIGQLKNHAADACGFPYSKFVYCLFKYRNREGRDRCRTVRRSLLGMCTRLDQIPVVLAQSPITLHILDIRVVEAMLRRFGSSLDTRGELYNEVLEVRHGTLAKLTPDNGDATLGYDFLRTLDVAPKTMRINTFSAVVPFQLGLLEFPIRVSITQVLPRALSKEVLQVLTSSAPTKIIGLAQNTACA